VRREERGDVVVGRAASRHRPRDRLRVEERPRPARDRVVALERGRELPEALVERVLGAVQALAAHVAARVEGVHRADREADPPFPVAEVERAEERDLRVGRLGIRGVDEPALPRPREHDVADERGVVRVVRESAERRRARREALDDRVELQTHVRLPREAEVARGLADEVDRIEAYYAERNGAFWVALDGDGQLLGMFGLEQVAGREEAVELRRMYVAPEARRRGVARAMLAYAESEARARGFGLMTLSTSEVQPAALALYRGTAYAQVREEAGDAMTNKTVGAGLRRFYFEKPLG
jgi:putative acetyltransferase